VSNFVEIRSSFLLRFGRMTDRRGQKKLYACLQSVSVPKYFLPVKEQTSSSRFHAGTAPSSVLFRHMNVSLGYVMVHNFRIVDYVFVECRLRLRLTCWYIRDRGNLSWLNVGIRRYEIWFAVSQSATGCTQARRMPFELINVLSALSNRTTDNFLAGKFKFSF
jgi:hypothetical protein